MLSLMCWSKENQGAPCLVLADPAKAMRYNLPVHEARGHTHIDEEKSSFLYLSLVYGVSRSPR
jgi:hypothetical protein